MKIEREPFLNDLQLVKAGLSAREFLEQSNSFVFRDGFVVTFNDEIACRKACSLKITGAVRADKLLAILDKIPDKVLDVHEKDGEIQFHGNKKRFGIGMDATILLPIEKVMEEMPGESSWRALPKDFPDIIRNAKDCASTDETNFALTCIHLHPEYIEASDNKQVLRWRINLGHKRSLLVRAEAISHLVDNGPTEIATSPSWIHFRCAGNGLIYSCRKFVEDFPNYDAVMGFTGHRVVIPKALIEVSERASIFANDIVGVEPTVLVSLRSKKVMVEGQALDGSWYKEIATADYDGPKIDFRISPSLLRHICNNYTDAQITETKLRATGGSSKQKGRWEYVTVLGKPKKSEPESAPAPAEEEEEMPEYEEEAE